MVQQDPEEVAFLVSELDAATKRSRSEGKKTFTCKRSSFAVAGSKITVESWRFMDWDYKRSGLPTYARGLFTTKRKDGTREIAVRGYDKFFNIDEVDNTKWSNIEKNTRGPYELSVKENGCIIFISGLEDDTLLVCSKHSTGSRSDTVLSHAQAGEQWVERHVTSAGKSVKDLARELRRLNVTAVGELCDDSFEEHVLAYDEASAGIYIHGINYNVPEFATMPGSEVHKFADAWGFKKANFVVYDDIDSVKKFLEHCAETGTWDGRETEGFVIRCQMREHGGPYMDWFFKYKFEEPYLMYRQWRECTKALIAGRLPRIKKHKQITEEYLLYARRQIAKNPKLGDLYKQNHGIISMRDGFLKERGLTGSEIIAASGDDKVTGDIILVPIASLGCGKTTVALALEKLFGWGHIQNDNIPKQKNKPKKFALDIVNLLAQTPVVIADRNNHQKRERQQLLDDILPVISNARFVALHYVHEPKDVLLPRIREVTRKRVLERGDNHQTIRAGTKDTREVVEIMEGFLKRFEGIDPEREPDSSFDEVIDLDVFASSRENLETIVNALHNFYPDLVKEVPRPEELDNAIEWAMTDYQVQLDLSHSYGPTKPQKQNKNKEGGNNAPAPAPAPLIPSPEALAKKIEYFSISLPSAEVSNLLHTLFPPSTSPEKARLYHHLTKSRRIQPAFHVTLIHRALKNDHPQIWERYTNHYINNMKETPGSAPGGNLTLAPARIRLERLIWDDRIMAFVARIMPPEDPEQADWQCANSLPHVTVGTASANVKPKESNDLLQRWLEVGSGGETGIYEAEIPGVKVVQGTVGLVMSRGK